MKSPLRVLLVEDAPDDALLLERHLRQGGLEPACTRVDSASALGAALREGEWDVVISDYRLPGFNGQAALKQVQARGQDVPFILVSGVVGEEQAVEAMKAGAHDFILKDKLARLVPAVERELRDAEVRRRRREAEQSVKEREQELAAIYENAPLLMLIVDEERRVWKVNQSAALFAEAPGASLAGRRAGEVLRCEHALDDPRGCGFGPFCQECPVHGAIIQTFQTGQNQQQVEASLTVSVNGKPREIAGLVSTARLNIRGEERVLLTIQNITRLKRAEEALRKSEAALQLANERLAKINEELRVSNNTLEAQVQARTAQLQQANQFLRMTSDCNEALVRNSNEMDLTQEICRIFVEVGGYRMAWVGMAEPDEDKRVRPIAAVGFVDGYLDQSRIAWADNKFGRGPTGTAIRTRKVCMGEDFLTDPKLAPWRKAALQHGFRSSIALPLLAGGRAFGALTIYAQQPRAFDPDRARVLCELAANLAFGITALRVQSDRNRAQRDLERRTAQLRALAAQLAQAEQRERRRIAQLLHDQLQQLLVGARYQLDGMQLDSSSADFNQARQQVDGLLSQCLETSRSLTLELSPPILHEAGLVAALKWLGRWFRETHGLTVRVIADEQAGAEEEELRVMLFVAVRELLFNVVKHGQVQQAWVRVSRLPENQLKIVVSDQGAGFDPARLRACEGTRSGFGLFSLRERLESLGGQMEVESAPGKGSRFTLLAELAEKPGAE